MDEDYKVRILGSTILMSQEVNPVGLHSAVKHSDLDALWLLGLTGQTKRAWPEILLFTSLMLMKKYIRLLILRWAAASFAKASAYRKNVANRLLLLPG